MQAKPPHPRRVFMQQRRAGSRCRRGGRPAGSQGRDAPTVAPGPRQGVVRWGGSALTTVFERAGVSRITPPVTSMSSQVRSRISCLRQPAARRVRRRWWGRRFPTRAVRRGPDERRVGGRCQGRGPCEAWLGVHRRAVMPRTSFSTPRHVPSETLECHRSWPVM